MIDPSYFEYMYGDVSNPIVISCRVTNEVVFLNHAMKKLINAMPTTYKKGKKCYEAIHSSDTPCEECIKELMSVGMCCERYITHESFNEEFKVITTIIDVKGEEFNVCKYFVYLQDNIDYSFEEAISDFFKATSQKNIDVILNSCLEILGKFYNAEKSYVYHVDQVEKTLNRQYFWTNIEQTQSSNNLDAKSLNLVLDRLVAGVDGVIDFNFEKSLSTLHELEKAFLLKKNIRNLAICPIINADGVIIAFVGVNNRDSENQLLDSRLLKATASYIEQNLERTQIISQLQTNDEIDSLTGLFKRNVYSIKVDQLNSQNHSSIGVIFTNINGLKKTNAQNGYTSGDKLIEKSANFLKETLADITFYRISGDEFVGFLTDISKSEFIEKLDILRNALKEHGEQMLAVGHAFEQSKNIDLINLINNADTLMYINKQEYYHSNHAIIDSYKISDEILSDLIYAIDNEEFLVYLQPKVNLQTDKVVGAEALIRRFNKTENKMIFPDQFISLYEKGSIIRHVDIYVLEKVCKILKEWEKNNQLIPISVNLSRVTLMEYDIVETVANVCKKYEIDTKYIVIEITERIGLLENNIASKLITDFKAYGFPLSLDDFGCAYSNIVTLAKIDVEEVKIDKSLIDDLIISEKNRIIVDNILNMCSSFKGTDAIAEGIETAEQAEILKNFGCLYGQGYFYSRPMPNEEFFEKYIK